VLINLVAAALWHYIPETLPRWLACATLVISSYVLLGRGLIQKKHLNKRTYHFAD
jgi:hypothetical protein